jgi:peptide/nickel transport system substrate-binding protein
VIVPMFNDFIDATSDKVGGWVDDGNQEMSGGYALSRCWLIA